MFKNRTAYLLIFTLAVIALLLRPFLTYQLAESQHLNRNPIAMNSLLRRLIKKKDDHHAKIDEEQAFIRQAEKKLLPSLWVTRVEKPGARPTHAFFLPHRPNAKSKFGLALHCYALYSRFLV